MTEGFACPGFPDATTVGTWQQSIDNQCQQIADTHEKNPNCGQSYDQCVAMMTAKFNASQSISSSKYVSSRFFYRSQLSTNEATIS